MVLYHTFLATEIQTSTKRGIYPSSINAQNYVVEDPSSLNDIPKKLASKAIEHPEKNSKYGHDFPRDFNNKTLDCSEFVFKILKDVDSALAKKIGGDGSQVNTKNFYNHIMNNGGFRTTSPKVGDFVMWYSCCNEDGVQSGHIEIITKVEGEMLVMYGAGSGDVPRYLGESSNGYMWLSSTYESAKNDNTIDDLASGEYRGFWTPEN